MVTQEKLKELFYLDESSYKFLRRTKAGPRALEGAIAGTLNKDGRIHVRIDGVSYMEHRLIWMYLKGDWPRTDLDHIDGNPTNNHINNLREVTKSQNMCNRIGANKNNKIGVRGVYFNGKRYRATITINRKQIYLGLYGTVEEAIASRKAAELKYHVF